MNSTFFDELRSADLSVKALTLLAQEESAGIRLAVAQNRNTPPDVLEILAKDKSIAVRAGVAGNPSTPNNVLKTLAKKDSAVLDILAKRQRR